MAHERTALSSSNNTAFEKIIRRHIVDQSDGELQEGDCKWILVDHVTVPWNMATLLTDLLPTVEKEFISALQQWRIDNYSQEERWNHQLSRRGTVREQTSWQVSGLPLAGSVLIGLEPSCIKWGALGCVSFPAVQCDFPDILSKSQVWLNIPPVIKIGISERVASVIGSNNIIQSVHTILERVGVTGPIAIEFTGKGCFYLSIEERMKIIDSVNNCNVICCLFPPDEKTKRHLYSKLENLQQVLNKFFIWREMKETTVLM
ncbi:hypothetical protein Gasu2_54910 [Galdieria sulphuraria]|nr:hypothetical protein Gasu2_54910 [Galdieria sulphuraria]